MRLKYSLYVVLLMTLSSCSNNDTPVSENYKDTSEYITSEENSETIGITVNGGKYDVTEYTVFQSNPLLRPVFRIPSCVITNRGTLLVSCENRQEKDDRGEIDILVARKGINSNTFEIRRVFKNEDQTGRSMNPVFLVDKKTSRIFLFVCHLKDLMKFARDNETDEVDFVYKYSDDDGMTWSEEVSLKELWDTDKYTSIIPSSVKGISTYNGELLLPTMVVKDKQWYSGLLICEDGKWRFSKPSPNEGDNECTVYIDLKGRIILDCRTYDKTIRRKYIYDMQKDKFTQIESSIIGCSVNISTEIVKDNDVFYMCFPDSPRNNRDNLTLYGSEDGTNWKKIYRMMEGYADYGYTSIGIDEHQMFTCYETNKAIYVQDLQEIKQIIHNEVGQ